MSRRDEYPATVREMLVDGLAYKRGVVRAVKRLRLAGAWRGSDAERLEKFRRCIGRLSRVYGIEEPRVVRGIVRRGSSGASCYVPAVHTITLSGRLSVVTMLHEFAHAMGKGERGAVKWSVNLFRRVWPEQFERCEHEGHVLVAG